MCCEVLKGNQTWRNQHVASKRTGDKRSLHLDPIGDQRRGRGPDASAGLGPHRGAGFRGLGAGARRRQRRGGGASAAERRGLSPVEGLGVLGSAPKL